MNCPFCRSTASLHHDCARFRVTMCDNEECSAENVISKGTGSWWYHGWCDPDGNSINADGKRDTGHRYGFWFDMLHPMMKQELSP